MFFKIHCIKIQNLSYDDDNDNDDDDDDDDKRFVHKTMTWNPLYGEPLGARHISITTPYQGF